MARRRVKMRPVAVLFAISATMLALRLYAATHVGFGDSEALYASYALHPQPAYLDHPGLVGLVARAIGGGAAPTPLATHVVTSVLATVVPWLALVAARAAGATWERAAIAAIALACAPEICVGLFALTPDLLLAFGWLGALALAAWGLRNDPGSTRAQIALLLSGVVAGAASAAKVTGVTLLIGLALAYGAPRAKPKERGIWPWAGLLAGICVLVPIALFEARLGWPMLRHRLVDTQAGAGPSLRNVAAIVFGQLAYVSPLLAIAAAVVLRAAWRARAEDAVSSLLFFTFAMPLAVLLPLALVSPVAEPHWLAPPLLALPIAWARSTSPSPISHRFGVAACATGLALSLAAHVWVLVPSLVRFLPRSFDPRWDLASELYGWSAVAAEVKEALPSSSANDSRWEDAVVVGPHWVVCAQLHAALGPRVAVGCATPIRDDFDDWLPRAVWQHASTVVFVTDNRFTVDPTSILPSYVPTTTRTLPIPRGGRTSRIFTITVMDRLEHRTGWRTEDFKAFAGIARRDDDGY